MQPFNLFSLHITDFFLLNQPSSNTCSDQGYITIRHPLHLSTQLHKLATTFLYHPSMLLPMFVIGLLNIVSFLIPSDNSDKISLSLNVLLATAVFIGVVHDDLPDRSDIISTVGEFLGRFSPLIPPQNRIPSSPFCSETK